VDAVSRVVEAKPSTAAPDRSRVAETPLPLVRPLAADIQALGTATVAYGHDVLGGRVTAGASPTVSVAPPAPTTAALPDDTARQIAQSIRLQVSRGGGEATIQLDPRHFGEMSITIRIEHGQVNARVQADSPVVREYLQSHHHVLRDSLAEQQLTLSKFEVAEPPAEPRQGDRRPADERAFQGERQPPRRRQPGTAASSFEPFEVIA
jgi:flagellar hook-length control protein FliK